MKSAEKQMPKEVAAAISGILKFLEKSEQDYINSKNSQNSNMQEEENYENS